jgi:hypothetical protein
LFTCFGYANLGLPLNPRDAFYYQTTPDRFGFTANPFGCGYRIWDWALSSVSDDESARLHWVRALSLRGAEAKRSTAAL